MKHLLKKAAISSLIATLVLFGMVSIAAGANSDTHQVTVTVAEINAILVWGGGGADITLTINTTESGGGQGTDFAIADATDSSCTLYWLTNGASKKITVEAALAGGDTSQEFSLTVLPTGASAGSPVGTAVDLTDGMLAADFITGAGQTIGHCTLEYTASATASQGTGQDILDITYTITTV